MAQWLEDKINVLSRNSPARCRISVGYRPQRIAKVMFLHPCVCPQGVGLPQCRDTIPLGAETPQGADNPPGAGTSPGSRRLLLRTVRILLECILVLVLFTEHLWISTVSPEMSPWHLKVLFGVVCIADKLSNISSQQMFKRLIFLNFSLEYYHHVAASPGCRYYGTFYLIKRFNLKHHLPNVESRIYRVHLQRRHLYLEPDLNLLN